MGLHGRLPARVTGGVPATLLAGFRRWIDRNLFELGREMRLSYLPPIMAYVAAGISGLTAIVGTFSSRNTLGCRPSS